MQIRRGRALAGVLALASALTVGSGSPAAAESAQPRSPGICHYLFPGLGTSGYDARHYTLNLRYQTRQRRRRGRSTASCAWTPPRPRR